MLAQTGIGGFSFTLPTDPLLKRGIKRMKKSFKFRCVLGVHPVDGKIVNQGDVFTLDYNILELVEGSARFYTPVEDSEDESEQEAAGKGNEVNEPDKTETHSSESGNTDVTNEGTAEPDKTETHSSDTDTPDEGTVENETSTGDDVTGGDSGESESKDDKPKRQRRGRHKTA